MFSCSKIVPAIDPSFLTMVNLPRNQVRRICERLKYMCQLLEKKMR